MRPYEKSKGGIFVETRSKLFVSVFSSVLTGEVVRRDGGHQNDIIFDGTQLSTRIVTMIFTEIPLERVRSVSHCGEPGWSKYNY